MVAIRVSLMITSVASSGTGGGAKREGPKKGLIPDRTVSTRGGSRGRGQSRGRGRGGTGRIQKRTTPQNQGQSQSQQAAKKRLLQAKKTLQLAIQVHYSPFFLPHIFTTMLFRKRQKLQG